MTSSQPGLATRIWHHLTGQMDFMPERVEQMFSTARLGTVLNFVIGTLFSAILSPSADPLILLAFLGAIGAVVALRFMIYAAYKRAPTRLKPIQWAWILFGTGAVLGSVWGALPLTGVLDDRPFMQVLIFLVVLSGSTANVSFFLWLPMYMAYPTFALSWFSIFLLRQEQHDYLYFAIMALVGVPLILAMGRGIGQVMVENFRLRLRDREMLAQLKVEKERALAATRAKSEFLATMSHEMRTPLNGIMGMMQILSRTVEDEEPRRHLAVARQASEALRAVIDDVLDFTKIEAGALNLEDRAFDLPALLREAAAILVPQAAAKGLALTTDVDPSVPRWLRGDPARLRQVLLNLLGNAVKFTERGTVTLAARVGEATSERVVVALSVADTGIGIDADVVDRLFQPFAQADGSISRRYGGSGLGLVISRRLTEAMGGTLGLRSTRGVGSQFDIALPLPRAEAPTPTTALPGSRPDRSLTILVVDDQPINREVAAKLLELNGHDVETVADGQAALDRLAERPFDAVLLDLHMPGLSGLDVARRIRGIANPIRAALPLLALSAATVREDIEACRAVGMDGFVPKPIVEDALLDAIARAVAGFTAFPDAPRFDAAATPWLDPEIAGQAIAAVGKAKYAGWVEGLTRQAEDGRDRILAAARAGDGVVMADIAHALAGAAAQLGGIRLTNEARAIERLALACEIVEAAHKTEGLAAVAAETVKAMRAVAPA